MSELILKDIEKEYGNTTVLNRISFTVNSNEKVGLIGRNGSGKTTIFRLILGEEQADYGEIIKRKGLKIGCLDQMGSYPDSYSVEDIVRLPFKELEILGEEIKGCEKRLEHFDKDNSEDIKVLERYQKIQQQYERGGGYEIESKIREVMVGLKIPSSILKRDYSILSGGEQVKINLAKLLLSDIDLLLLDEPTNHLDIEAVEWLENYLKDTEYGVLIISHDRFFLDRVVSRLMEIENGSLLFTKGNYTTHIEEKSKRSIHIEREYSKQQKEIRSLKESIERTLITGKKQGNPALLRKATLLQKKLDSMVILPKPKAKPNVDIRFSKSCKGSKIVLRLSKITKSFGDNLLLKDLDLTIMSSERVAILGKNGSGKSTLLKIAMGSEDIDSGEVLFGEGNRVAYLDQNLEFDSEEVSIIDLLLNYHKMDQFNARKLLTRYLFDDDDLHKKIGDLSGGERTRLKLAILFSQNINTLILDEPTNHLDIDSREMLEQAIINFGKGLIFISHDRYFISKMANRVVEIENKQIRDYEGDYQFYQSKRAERRIVTSQIKKGGDDYQKRKKESRLREQRAAKIEKLEQLIESYETRVLEIDDEMVKSGDNYEMISKLDLEKREVEGMKDRAYSEWESLMEE